MRRVTSLEADLEFVHPDDRERYRRFWNFLPLNRESQAVIEYRLLPVNGPMLHVREVEVAIPAEDGSYGRAVGFTQDITDRVLAEKALARAHEELERRVAERTAELRKREWQLKQSHEIAQLGYWFWDPVTDVLTVSPELMKILQLPAGEDLLFPYSDFVAKFVHPDDREIVMKLDTLSREKRRFETEYRLVRQDGEARWVREVGEVVFDDAGEPLGETGIVQDVTEQRQDEVRLRQIQKMEAVGQLTGGVAHDFNNLLTVILGNLELGIDATRHGQDADGFLTAALKATVRSADLTKQLLAFSGNQTSAVRVGNVNEVIRGMTSLLHRILGEEFVLETSFWPAECASEFDPAQLESAIINLAINSRDAMAKGGTLRIETTLAEWRGLAGNGESERMVRISVVDSGVGMEPEVRERSFEPFYTTKEDGKGTGLGLSMVYGFARRCGGELEIESEPGRGTTVHILLP